jgi:hypothetical protein
MSSLIAKLILSLALVASAAQAACAQDAVTFRYRFEPGEKLTYDVSTTVKQTQNVNGQAVKSEFAVSQRVEREVAQIDGSGNFLLTSRNQKVTATMQIGPLGRYQFDSDRKDNESTSALGAAATPLYTAISKAAIKVRLSPQGEVLAVSGLQEALEDVLKSNPLTAQLAGGANTNEGAKASYAEHFLQFPEKALSPGDTWELRLQLPIPQVGEVSGKTTCRYEGTQEVNGRTLHRVTASSDITVDVNIDRDGVTATGKIEMTNSSGTNLFDLESGRLISRESETTTSGDLVVVAGGQTLPIRQTQTQTHKIRLVGEPAPGSR